VIVEYPNIMGVAIPTEHDPVLDVDPDAPEALPVSTKSFQAVPRRRSKVLKTRGSI